MSAISLTMMNSFFNFWRKLFGGAEPQAEREDDRRVWVRHPSSVGAFVKPVNNGVDRRHSAQVRDVSRGGIKLVVDHEFVPGSMIGVDLPGSHEQASTVLACVVHSTRLSDHEWSLGCEFSDELSDSELESFGARRKRPSKGDDNRGWVRFPCNTKAACQRVDVKEPGSWPATVTDISASGIGLVADRSVDTGALLSLNLQSPTGNSARTILAAVVHVTTRPGKEWVLGCNFIRELESADLKALT